MIHQQYILSTVIVNNQCHTHEKYCRSLSIFLAKFYCFESNYISYNPISIQNGYLADRQLLGWNIYILYIGKQKRKYFGIVVIVPNDTGRCISLEESLKTFGCGNILLLIQRWYLSWFIVIVKTN